MIYTFRKASTKDVEKVFAFVGAVVLLEEDDRWADRADSSAFYIHNLVTDSNRQQKISKTAFHGGVSAISGYAALN